MSNANPSPVHENATSKAVEQLAKGSVAPLLYRRGVRTGIAAKYKRMEDALIFYASRDNGDSDGGNIAKLALDFDPLSNPTDAN